MSTAVWSHRKDFHACYTRDGRRLVVIVGRTQFLVSFQDDIRTTKKFTVFTQAVAYCNRRLKKDGWKARGGYKSVRLYNPIPTPVFVWRADFTRLVAGTSLNLSGISVTCASSGRTVQVRNPPPIDYSKEE
jgi:hypothetical protein